MVTLRLQNFTGFAAINDPTAFVELVFDSDKKWKRTAAQGFDLAPAAGVWTTVMAQETHVKTSASAKPQCILSDCNMANLNSLDNEGEFYWYRDNDPQTIGGRWLLISKA